MGAAGPAAFKGLMAEAVVGRFLLRVFQSVVSLADFLELGFSGLVAGIGIRVELLGELPVSGLEVFLIGALANAENLIKITFCHW